MQGRARILAVLAVGVIVAIIFWIAMVRTMVKGSPDGSPGAGAGAGSGSDTPALGATAPYDGGRIERTIHDRRVRDELRRRILASWAEGEGESAEAARHGRFEPMPPGPNGEYVDPAYIQEVIRGDMFPMARECYEQLLARQPDAGGRVEMFFKIIGDDKLGGIVDEVELDGGAPDAIRDEQMNLCIRESLLTVAFRPPPGDGVVTIGYPIVFAPGERDE